MGVKKYELGHLHGHNHVM